MLPTVLRGGLIEALLRAFLTPLVWLMLRFHILKEESIARLSGNGQGLSIIEVLSRKYNVPSGDIYIQDEVDPSLYAYYTYEGTNKIVLHFSDAEGGKRRLYFEDEGRATPDFYIYLPDHLREEEEEIVRLIQVYKPAGRTYQIKYYSYA